MSNIGVIKMLRKNHIIKFKIVIIEEGIEDIRIIFTPTQLRHCHFCYVIVIFIKQLSFLLRNCYTHDDYVIMITYQLRRCLNYVFSMLEGYLITQDILTWLLAIALV